MLLIQPLNKYVKVSRNEPHQYEVGDFVHILQGMKDKEVRTFPGSMPGGGGGGGGSVFTEERAFPRLDS